MSKSKSKIHFHTKSLYVLPPAPSFEGVCTECKGSLIDTYEGDLVCSQCGLVDTQKKIDFNNIPRKQYTSQEKEDRLNTSPLGRPFGNRTFIWDVLKYTYCGQNKSLYRRLSKINNSMQTGYERALYITRRENFNVFSYFKLPSIIQDETWILYKKLLRKGFIRGYSRDITFATVLYIISRKHQYPLLLNEVAEYYGLAIKNLSHCITKIFKNFYIKMPPLNIRRYLIRICSELQIKYDLELVDALIRASRTHKAIDPKGIIAAIAYILSKKQNKDYTQFDIAAKIGITELTLRARMVELLKKGSLSPQKNLTEYQLTKYTKEKR